MNVRLDRRCYGFCLRSTGEGLTLNQGADELLEPALGVLSQLPTPGAFVTRCKR
jgi:hypothetical protein